MSERMIQLGSKNAKELWRWDRRDVSGDEVSVFRGVRFIIGRDGTARETGDDPKFSSEAEGRAWLEVA